MSISSSDQNVHAPSALTFIIPIRHPENARDWKSVKSILAQTMRSISAQTCDDWNAIIVANRGSDLPALPARFDVKWVDFPPNPIHERGDVDEEEWYNACRFDKGQRVLAGMLHGGRMGHVMIVDDDDFVSRKLAAFVASNRTSRGWYLSIGYMWEEGGKLLFRAPDFHTSCGTSHIIRADLYDIPESLEAASGDYIRVRLGSHRFTVGMMEKAGNPLCPLPFIGAIYRIGHGTAHSKSAGILRTFFIKRALRRKPFELLRRGMRLRPLTRWPRREFMGWSLPSDRTA